MNIDPNGRAWWHWAFAGTVVVACAVATVATCGGFAAAATAVGLVASGTAAATTASTIAAGAFVASATTLGAVAFDAAINSSTEEEFMDNGNWETVASTALSGLIGAGYGYLIDKLQNSNYYDSSSTNRYCEKTDTCFVAGTLIETENGSLPIELILVGMKVYATDPNTGEIALKDVLNTFVRKSSELIHITVNGEKITTTPTHPFWVPQKGWVDAIQLRAGDRLQLLNGEYVIIEQIQHEILETPITVYNFEVAKLHTYYVSKSQILVHNANCGITSPNQMQMQVERGQAPKGVLRVDNPKIPGQQPHIHFSDGTSLNIDGSVHDRKNGIPNLTNEIKIWLEKMVGKEINIMKAYAGNRNDDKEGNEYNDVEILCNEYELELLINGLAKLKKEIEEYRLKNGVVSGFTHMHFRDINPRWNNNDADLVIYVDLNND